METTKQEYLYREEQEHKRYIQTYNEYLNLFIL